MNHLIGAYSRRRSEFAEKLPSTMEGSPPKYRISATRSPERSAVRGPITEAEPTAACFQILPHTGMYEAAQFECHA